MKRFVDNMATGVLVGLVAVAVCIALIGFGILLAGDSATKTARRDLEATGVGRYIEIDIDGYRYHGWVHP